MTARQTYATSVVTAVAASVASKTTATAVQQEAINAAGVNIGLNPQLGASAATIATIKKAVAANVASVQLAAMVYQVAQNAAKDTLRATGDVGVV